MMSATFPYTFQPQPPSHPKTTGGKQGPSVPLTCSEDEGTRSVSNHNPPVRLTTLDISSTRPKIKSSIVSVSNFSTAHNHFTAKKPGLVALQALSNNNNNLAVLNLNHVALSASSNHSPVTTTASFPNSFNTFNIGNINDNSIVCLATIINTNATSSSSNHNYLHSTATVIPSVPCSTSQSTSEQSAPSTNEQPSPLAIRQQSPSSNGQPSQTTNGQLVTNVIVNEPEITASQTNAIDNDHIVSTLSTVAKDIPAVSPPSPNDHSFGSLSNFAYEHDHDYESVSSPCSSTASGPIYVRPAGFTHHAQEIEVPHVKNKLKKKKYLTSLVTVREGYKKREATPPKLKPKREPLPMKLRALPQSFWQQPNVAHQVSPATLFLPPLLNKDSEEVMMDVRPVTPPEEREERTKKSQAPERKLIVTNTDLLFKLFDGIKEGKKSNNSFKSRAIKARKLIPRSNTKGLLLGNDPYMVDAVTEKIFPQLTLEGSRHFLGGGNTSLQLITLREGDRTVTLPSLSLEQNYPQMLSELVSHI